jgi:hypothetical protein
VPSQNEGVPSRKLLAGEIEIRIALFFLMLGQLPTSAAQPCGDPSGCAMDGEREFLQRLRTLLYTASSRNLST